MFFRFRMGVFGNKQRSLSAYLFEDAPDSLSNPRTNQYFGIEHQAFY